MSTARRLAAATLAVSLVTGAWAAGAAAQAVVASPRMLAAPMAVVGDRVDPLAQRASAQTRRVVAWILASGDHGGAPFFVIDKRHARLFVFDPDGRARGDAPVLLGLAPGDDTVPGIGERALADILPHERTTPAGRFVAERGTNLQGEPVIWVDYDAGVSMHRVRPLAASERRLARLHSPSPADNRISYGCINVPVRFYDEVVEPAWDGGRGIVIYVLPETRSLADVFGPALRGPAPHAPALRGL